MMRDKAKFERYAELKNDIKRLEEEITALAPEVMVEMGEVDELSTEFGMFTVGKRRKWTYPKDVEKATEDAKNAQKEAQQLGTATFEENPYLIFKAGV